MVLAVGLFFSAACFFIVHEHFIVSGDRFQMRSLLFYLMRSILLPHVKEQPD